jgi:hypothetical protein
MKTLIQILATAGLLAVSGCSIVTSSQPPVTNATGEAWYTEATGIFGITWAS